MDNLDTFLTRVYSYYAEKGFVTMVVARISNLLTLGFTIVFSCFLFLYVNWSILFTCQKEACDR